MRKRIIRGQRRVSSVKRADALYMRKRRAFEARERRIAAAVLKAVLEFAAQEIDAQNLWWCPDEV